MKIGAILEKSQDKKLADIAKDDLTIGEKFAREALKKAGCFNIKGKRGWHYEGDPAVLNHSIYKYAPAKKINRKATVKVTATNKPKANVTTKEFKKETFKEPTLETSNVLTKDPIIQINERTNVETNIVRKRSSFDLDTELMKELKIQAIIHERNVYEMVETAIRHYLAELKGEK